MSCFTSTHHLATDWKRLPPDSELFPLLSLLKVASLSRNVGVGGTHGGHRGACAVDGPLSRREVIWPALTA